MTQGLVGKMANQGPTVETLGVEGQILAPCRAKCPVHIDVPGYLNAVAEGRFTDALEIVLHRNPLPSVCGRVCLRPCEEGCRRCLLDEPVAIAQLKRAAADFGSYPSVRRVRPRPESVAIVGGGPAGLAAAESLAKHGIQVSIYEQQPKLGGMMRYGIPTYRLPDEALDRDIEYILEHGVEVHTGVRIGRDITLGELAEKHDRVLVTAGLQGSRPVPIPGHDGPNILTALPFLEACSCGERVEVGNRVIVIGGGNVAMDVARSAVRMGARHVRVVCLESETQMPATREEIDDARMEGIEICTQWGPASVEQNYEACELRVKRCTSLFDENGRFSPVLDEDIVDSFRADTIIFAVGQSADVRDLELDLNPRGMIDVDPLTLRTSDERVYAAGDVVSGPTKIIDAVAAGQRAAAAIHGDITGDMRKLRDLDADNATLGEMPETMTDHLETRRRIRMEQLEHYEAMESFEEIELGYTEYEAAREAQRCLGCTTGARLTAEKCAQCLTCLRVCPHGAPSIKMGGMIYFDPEACHACGACSSLCPAHAISLEGFSEEEMSQRIDRVLADEGLDTTLVFACGCTPNLPEIPGSDVRVMTVTCLLRLSEQRILEALQLGASRVVFAGCVEATCRFPHARVLVERLTKSLRGRLAQVDMEDAFIVIGGADEEEVTHLI
jgi:NADPH-dependent glutamate synthase beta subunit-like oxidoreductase